MKNFFTILLALTSAICAMAQEEFKFEVTTTAANPTFRIPTSGGSGSTSILYNWTITWDVGGAAQNVTGSSSTTSAGISHTYTTHGVHEITIKPNGGNDRWLAAFGFHASGGANVQTNKDMVTKVISPITPLMTRTQAQLDSGIAPNYEWARTFYGCTNLTMGPAFTFSNDWNSITTVGNQFAWSMFNGCSSNAFNMNAVFNLPQNITAIGNDFAWSMFQNCSGAAFTMNSIFNLPQNITAAKDGFACDMFNGCSGAAFNMNTVFNLPQNITTASNHFADGMFNGCKGAAFKMNTVFNLPQNITTIWGNGFAKSMFQSCSGAAFNMNAIFNIPQNITGAVACNFVESMFDGCSGAAFNMNAIFNLPQNITAESGNFATGMFQGCRGAAFTMNTIFNLPQNIVTASEGFAAMMFNGCNGDAFNMNSIFNLPQNVTQTTVGDNYAFAMFFGGGKAFTMNTIFNLPQNFTKVGYRFAASMFGSCSGAAFKMNDIFNLPPNITTVGNDFAWNIFYGCSGAAFTMNSVFNLPQNITTMQDNFANGMFYNCSGDAFRINNVFKFPRLTSGELNKLGIFESTFRSLKPSITQTRTAASIINGNNFTPTRNKYTFFSSGNYFIDRPYLHIFWGGDNASPPTFTVTYNYNGATGGNTIPSKTLLYINTYGYNGQLPLPTKELTVTYDYNGSSQANNSETYNGIFGGWYLENTFVNVVTNTTIVTTFSDHTLYAKWGGGLTLPTPNENTGYTFAGWYSEAACVNLVGNAGATYIPTANTTLYAKWTETSGIDDIFANSIIIYPNPTNYELKITNYDGEIKNVEICDLAGQTVGANLCVRPNGQDKHTGLSLQGNTTINVSSLPQGVYLVKIYTDKGVVTKRFIKM